MQKKIALTIKQACKGHEASYDTELMEYAKSLETCLQDAAKANELPESLWYMLSLAMHWRNDLNDWADEILKGGDNYVIKPFEDYPYCYEQHITLYLKKCQLTLLNQTKDVFEEAKFVVNEERAQLEALNYEDVITELLEVGAWSVEELRAEDKDDNFSRLCWIVAGYIEGMDA
jgi:hypothetical protein